MQKKVYISCFFKTEYVLNVPCGNRRVGGIIHERELADC